MAESNNFETLLAWLRTGLPDDPDAGWRAAIELGDVTDDQQKTDAVTALMEALSSGRSHALIRAHAAESLGRLGDARALPALRSALDDSYRLVRAYAAGALSRLDTTPDSIDVLVNRMGSDNFFGVRAESASALGNMAANSTDADLRRRVREALEARLIIERANPAPGIERVIADIERALLRLPPTA